MKIETKVIRLTRDDIDKLLEKGRINYGVQTFDCDSCSEEKQIVILITLDSIKLK